MSNQEGAAAEPRQSLPGWSLARDAPRPKAKQGWECPVPTVQDWEDYKKWKQDQERKDELPAAPQVFLADSSLLFHKDVDVDLPWIHRLKCELPRRVGRLSGELPVKASFIGFGSNDDASAYETFKEAMAQIGIVFCRQIRHPPSRFDIAHLEQSDLILVGGGDRKRLWETLGTDLGCSEVAEHVKWRYLQGALVIAVGEAVSLLGERSWYVQDTGSVVPFTGWKIFPHIVALEDEKGVDLEDMVETLGGAKVVILGLGRGGGLIFNKDGLVEPVRHMVQEYRWDWRSEGVKRALLVGPPRGTGLLCPLYAAMKEREEDDLDETDVFAFALTAEEEQEEEALAELWEAETSSWATVEVHNEVLSLKESGNQSLKSGQPSLAALSYRKARLLLQHGAKPWGQLSEAERKSLEALGQQQREGHRATVLGLPLLLNICAARLAMHEESKSKGGKTEEEHAGTGKEGAGPSTEASTALVEVSDDLGVAFCAANDALQLTGGQSAKAWFRRGCVFEALADPRSAVRDFEEALKRSPGDKAVKLRRDAAEEAAGKVAEELYYARHKELDPQVEQLQLPQRRVLSLCGCFGDTYVDKDESGQGQFAAAQPLAWLQESTLEEVDGRLQLVAASNVQRGSGAAFLHPHALWTWEFLVQKAAQLQYLSIEDVDLGSGPLEWICKGLRTHKEVKVVRFVGCHIGSLGAKMLRNVVAQNCHISELVLDACGLHDSGLAELSSGLADHKGSLAYLSLRRNFFTQKSVAKLGAALCKEDSALSLVELDLSGNPLALAGAKEVGKMLATESLSLQTLRLQNCLIDCPAFWRLVGNLKSSQEVRALSVLDLRCNPLGRGTRRLWKSTVGPTTKCQVLVTGDPRQALKEEVKTTAEFVSQQRDARGIPLPRAWV